MVNVVIIFAMIAFGKADSCELRPMTGIRKYKLGNKLVYKFASVLNDAER